MSEATVSALADRRSAAAGDDVTVHMPADVDTYLPPEQWRLYEPVLQAARAADIPFALGGGLATALYGGLWRNGKDIDVYVRRDHRERLIEITREAGFDDLFDARPYDRSWIYRGVRDDVIVDVMWALANGFGDVEPAWLARAVGVEIRGVRAGILAPEELLLTKIHVLQRERCDWPDVINVLHAVGPAMDWMRVRALLGGEERLVGSLLLLFAWVAPGRAALLPDWVWRWLRIAPPDPSEPSRDDLRIARLDTRPWFSAVDV